MTEGKVAGSARSRRRKKEKKYLAGGTTGDVSLQAPRASYGYRRSRVARRGNRKFNRSLLRRRDPGRFAAREQPPLFGSPFRPARFGRLSACGRRALQTLCQPPRQRGHAQIPTGGADTVRAQQFSKKSSPYHVTQDDVSTPLQRLEVAQITGHQSVRGRGDVIAVLYKTHWAGLSEPSWEREMDLHLSRSHILRYWAEAPEQHRQTNRLYRGMRIGAAQPELSLNIGERFLAPGCACVPRADWLRRYHDTVLLKGAHFWYKGDDGLWWLEKISASATEDKVYLVHFLDDRDRLNFLFPRRATRLRR